MVILSYNTKNSIISKKYILLALYKFMNIILLHVTNEGKQQQLVNKQVIFLFIYSLITKYF